MNHYCLMRDVNFQEILNVMNTFDHKWYQIWNFYLIRAMTVCFLTMNRNRNRQHRTSQKNNFFHWQSMCSSRTNLMILKRICHLSPMLKKICHLSSRMNQMMMMTICIVSMVSCSVLSSLVSSMVTWKCFHMDNSANHFALMYDSCRLLSMNFHMIHFLYYVIQLMIIFIVSEFFSYFVKSRCSLTLIHNPKKNEKFCCVSEWSSNLID